MDTNIISRFLQVYIVARRNPALKMTRHATHKGGCIRLQGALGGCSIAGGVCACCRDGGDEGYRDLCRHVAKIDMGLLSKGYLLLHWWVRLVTLQQAFQGSDCGALHACLIPSKGLQMHCWH